MKNTRNTGPSAPAHHRQRGMTLIELAVVLAIGLVLILAGLKFAPALMTSSRVQAETQNLGQLVTSTRNLYQGRYATLTVAQAIQFNLAPAGMVNGAALAGNWGTVTPAPALLAGGAPNTAMAITLAGIPQAVCVQLAPALLGIADEMDVNGVAVKNTGALVNPLVGTVAAACGVAGGGAVPIVIRAI
jgi:prepilin-type N-terminal cleavage/methylation domain-containing protein